MELHHYCPVVRHITGRRGFSMSYFCKPEHVSDLELSPPAAGNLQRAIFLDRHNRPEKCTERQTAASGKKCPKTLMNTYVSRISARSSEARECQVPIV